MTWSSATPPELQLHESCAPGQEIGAPENGAQQAHASCRWQPLCDRARLLVRCSRCSRCRARARLLMTDERTRGANPRSELMPRREQQHLMTTCARSERCCCALAPGRPSTRHSHPGPAEQLEQLEHAKRQATSAPTKLVCVERRAEVERVPSPAAGGQGIPARLPVGSRARLPARSPRRRQLL